MGAIWGPQATWGPHKGAKWGHMGPHGATWGPHGATSRGQMGPHGVTWGHIGATWGHMGPHGATSRGQMGPHGATLGPHGATWGYIARPDGAAWGHIGQDFKTKELSIIIYITQAVTKNKKNRGLLTESLRRDSCDQTWSVGCGSLANGYLF